MEDRRIKLDSILFTAVLYTHTYNHVIYMHLKLVYIATVNCISLWTTLDSLKNLSDLKC